MLTTGATMANFVALAAARNWWGEQPGRRRRRGWALEHFRRPSSSRVVTCIRAPYRQSGCSDSVGRTSAASPATTWGDSTWQAVERELAQRSEPAIVIANAGEVNAGDFDPIVDVAELAERHQAWLHVDGAFGLFARLAPATRQLTEGIDRADSVICDAHKWLNVPYDCGFAFVRQVDRLPRALNVGAPYLPSSEDPHPNFGFVSPENSRRARALTVWATLRAYGRVGYRADGGTTSRARSASRGAQVDAAPELERLADVPLNIVCFRARPRGAQ